MSDKSLELCGLQVVHRERATLSSRAEVLAAAHELHDATRPPQRVERCQHTRCFTGLCAACGGVLVPAFIKTANSATNENALIVECGLFAKR